MVYLLSLFTASIKLVITIYLLHLLTRIETRTRIKTIFLQAKKQVFSLPSPIVYLNYLHRLSIASIYCLYQVSNYRLSNVD